MARELEEVGAQLVVAMGDFNEYIGFPPMQVRGGGAMVPRAGGMLPRAAHCKRVARA